MTLAGNVIEIPNFLETFHTQVQNNVPISEFAYDDDSGLIPIYWTEHANRFACDIRTGQWTRNSIEYKQLLFWLSNYDNQILQKRVQTLEQTLSETKRQVQEMMAMWNHVRESNVIIDEWLKTCKEVVASGSD